MEGKEKLTKEHIMSAYTDAVLESNSRPKSVYAFTKANTWAESEFYAYFSDFEALEKAIFNHFALNASTLVRKAWKEQGLEAGDALLTWYYTSFEVLTQNRSFVKWALQQSKNPLKSLTVLKDFKEEFLAFYTDLDLPESFLQLDFLEDFKAKSEKEATWLHFLSVLKFWMADTSENFEKTDAYIEKSIQFGLEMRSARPFDKLMDLGKFMWSEKSNFFS